MPFGGARIERLAHPGRHTNLSLLNEDKSMTSFDFAPLYRSTVGFDRLVQLLNQAGGIDNDASGYPPYNIERTGENAYRITLAVAGFAEAEIAIELKEQMLTVKGEKSPAHGEQTFLHRGIAGRTFERRFQLADHVEVKGADLRDGLLHLELVRNVPERLKPRQIVIGGTSKAPQLETAKAA